MIEDAKRFLCRLGLFAIPVLLYAALIVAVDPYNYLGVSSLFSDKVKLETSFKLNYALWKVMEFRRQPVPNILLGDSRMLGLDAEEITTATGSSYYNFAYGGGSLREEIATFWHVVENHPLEKVYFGVNLNLYTAANDRDRVAEATSMLATPPLYLCNLNVVTAAGRILQSSITGGDPRIGVPDMSPEEFWKQQLAGPVKAFYASYRYPTEYHEQLKEIGAYCQEEGIGLYFIIFPSHTDLQAKVAAYDLEDEYRRFKADLSAIAPTFDFDYENTLTSNRDEYRDPFHFRDEIRDVIVRSVWGEDRTYVRVLGG